MALLDLNSTFGAFLIGVVVSSSLFGVTCLQTWYYFQNYSDRILLKLIVITLLILEILHSIAAIHAIYHHVILNFANPSELTKEVWSVTLTIPVTSAIMFITHLFYASRIYRLSGKNVWITGLIVVLKGVHLGLGITLSVLSARAPNYETIAADKHSLSIVIASLSFAVILDVTCAVSLSFYLHRHRSGIQSTDMLINRLILYTINNGILTSIVSICSVAFAVREPHNFIYFSIFEVTGNLYTNSLLATLNSRPPHRQVLPVTVESGQCLTTFEVATAMVPPSHSESLAQMSRNDENSLEEKSMPRGLETSVEKETHLARQPTLGVKVNMSIQNT